MSITTITSKGQITLPKSIRDRLALKVGDRLRVSADRHGRVRLDPDNGPAAQDLYGVLHRLAPSRPASLDEMRAAVRVRAREAFVGKRR
jgi:AbrB family looped-hinge helix DNA binding protein